MARAEVVTDGEGHFSSVMFDCPGCGFACSLPTDWTPPGMSRSSHLDRPGPRWGFNGDLDRPTFTPSVLVRGVERFTDDEYARVMAGEKIEPRPLVCHSFVTDGRIQFLGDCTHAYSGQTLDLPEISA